MSFKKNALWFGVILVVVGAVIWLYKKFLQGAPAPDANNQ